MVLTADPGIPGSIPGAISFSEKLWVWNGELLKWESSGSGSRKIEINVRGNPLH
jgi:hypothetical protein